ncbi:MAG: hypothetical protein V3V05_01550 [Pontiella sp.]
MKTNESKCGFALVTVLVIVSALAVMLTMLTKMGSQRVFDTQRMTNKAKALAYAEAGVDFAYAIISPDFDQRNNSALFANKTSYGEGGYTLTVTAISNNYALINSVGECGGISQTAEALVEDIYADSGGSDAIDYASMDGFNYAILSGGQFGFKGSGYIAGGGGKLHSNSAININGSAQTEISVSSTVEISVGKNTIVGSISAPLLDLHKFSNITAGSTTATVPPVAIPDIDFTPYYNWALDHGEVHNGFSTTADYTPVGGILYVIGDVSISSFAKISGSIIATGNIKISGQVTVTPTIDTIALATGSGNIQNTSSKRITGLVYSNSGNYKQTANGELFGQLIIGGEIQKGGNSDIVFFQQSIPTPPGVCSVTPVKSLPVIAGWQK